MKLRLMAAVWAAKKAKEMFDRRGGADALRADAARAREAAGTPGSAREKAQAVFDALRRPQRPAGDREPPS